jgi:uncharacterized membrane protein
MATQTTSQETQTGLDENIAGALSYVLGLITGIIFFVLEGDNRFVKFHAAQSIVYSVVVIVVNIAFTVLGIVLAFIPRIGGIFSGLVGLVSMLVSLVFFLGWLFLMYKAFQHEEYELPLVGGIARSIAA